MPAVINPTEINLSEINPTDRAVGVAEAALSAALPKDSLIGRICGPDSLALAVVMRVQSRPDIASRGNHRSWLAR